MTKFDGILLASDWDGTICNGTSIPEQNIEALKYFKSQGGIFTVCSGRHYLYLKQFEDLINPNTYVISLNGALIANKDTDEILYEGFLDNSVVNIIDELYLNAEIFDSLNILIKGKDRALTLSREDYKKRRASLLQQKIYKVLMVSSKEENAIIGCKYVNSLNDEKFVAVRSWLFSMEILNPSNTKGEGLGRLAKELNARKTIAIGDFENDISMLQASDIGFAVLDAPENVRKKADAVTAAQSDGALAAVIYELEHII